MIQKRKKTRLIHLLNQCRGLKEVAKVISVVICLGLLLCFVCSCEGFWEEDFDNTYWEIDTNYNVGSWDDPNQEWDSETAVIEYLGISEIGTWVENFRPTRFRLSFTGATGLAIGLLDANGDPIVQLGEAGIYPVASEEEIEIPFGDYDIASFLLVSDSAFSVTNIEFFVPCNSLLWEHIFRLGQ